ncbi:MAG: SPFH domain-containing protein [Saccharofermentans sp.]|nr:SPFH domain-containing protein [Saccharofermentans sp.]
MGLLKLGANIIGNVRESINSEFADQYLEFFTCDALGQNVLAKRGAAQIVKGKNKGSAEIISNGSKIAVPEGTALLLVDAGKVVDFTTEAGMYTWDSSTSPSVFGGGKFLENVKASVKDTWERMKNGGELAKQQRVYFVNMQEVRDQNFGTKSPIPYHDPEYRNIYIRLNGKFSFKIEDPVTFFRAISGNFASDYTVQDLMGTPADPKQPREEFIDNMTEVLNKCGSVDKIMFADLPAEQGRLRRYMQEALDEEWLQKRGLIIDTVAIGGITPDDKSRQRIEEVDQAKMYGSDPNALAAQAVLGQTEAMKLAGANPNGAVNGMMGIGMMGGMAGGQTGTAAAFNFLGQQQAQQAAAAPAAAAVAAGWTCSCGQGGNTGKFCGNCGQPQPAPAAGWTCSCGQTNTGKFCGNCGQPQPAAAPLACPNCGYKPADGSPLGKFCPECGNKI